MLSLGSLADVLRGCLLVSLRSDILWKDDGFLLFKQMLVRESLLFI
jgi:CII-binding regulator of phage lambda lysogenization HflD